MVWSWVSPSPPWSHTPTFVTWIGSFTVNRQPASALFGLNSVAGAVNVSTAVGVAEGIGVGATPVQMVEEPSVGPTEPWGGSAANPSFASAITTARINVQRL